MTREIKEIRDLSEISITTYEVLDKTFFRIKNKVKRLLQIDNKFLINVYIIDNEIIINIFHDDYNIECKLSQILNLSEELKRILTIDDLEVISS